MQVNTYVDDLFRYIDRFENEPTRFDTEAFLQTYNGVYAVFQALRQQRGQAIEVDQFFLAKIKETNLSRSDLRLLTIQILITYFEAEADIDGQSNKSYLYCRDMRQTKRDVAYFENYLAPLLFAEAGLNWNFRLTAFFLGEMARYMNTYGKRLEADMPPEAFNALSESSRFMLLARRRLELGEDLLAERASLEFHLKQVNAFSKLSLPGPIHKEFLTEWGYLSTAGVWSRFRVWLTEFFGKFRGAFSSWRYLRLLVRQRNPAYLFYSLLIILCVFLAIYVPSRWRSYSDEQQQKLERHFQELQSQSKR